MVDADAKNIRSKILDHFGLVADTIGELGLIKKIDARLPVSFKKGAKTSMGERVAAMIFNGLGFIDNRLYLFPEFLQSKAVPRLFDRELSADYFNDDALGRCLDAISTYGVTKLFTELSFEIGMEKGLLGKSVHFDTTTLQVWGAYDDEPEGVPYPARGHSKSHRPDLKQMVLNLATTGKSGFPVWMEAHSGNASDQKVLPDAAQSMSLLCDSLAEAPEFLYVGDSAMYCNVLSCTGFKWCSRVPETIKEAKGWVQAEEQDLKWVELPGGYHYHVTRSNYGGVEQRWVLIRSEQAHKREKATLERKIVKEREGQEKQWKQLSQQIFSCEKDAQVAIQQQKKKLKYHVVTSAISPQMGYAQKGRPKKGTEKTLMGYRIHFSLEENQEIIARETRSKGRFVLATNELDIEKLPDADILREYKAQSGVEKSFKFIKNNAFEVDSIFVEKEGRIEALMMIMTLCLMVYGYSEFIIRKALANNNHTVPNPGGRPTNRPSMKRIYQLFVGIHEVHLPTEEKVKRVVINVTELIEQILSYFGERAQRIYLEAT